VKLHRLEITGIGPFAGTETVDFDRLDESGVFLLTGRTGSGKTTVLDAVSYAIFGSIPRDADGAAVVSHHRRLETTPGVLLEATVGGTRTRVHRSPQHERPVKKGEGTTTEGQSLLVERHSRGEWEPVTGKWREGNEWLEERIGMTADQFNQVVMLPQGEFSKFLDASAHDRRVLLQRLFPGADLAWLESWLKERATTAARERDAKLEEISNHFQRVLPVVRDLAGEDEDPLPDHGDRDVTARWIETTGTRLAGIAGDAEQARLKAHDAWDRSAAALAALEKQTKLVAERKKADTELAELEKRRSWRRETGDRLDAARRAAGTLALAGTADSRRREHEEAEAELRRLEPVLAEARMTKGVPSGEYVKLRERLENEARTIGDFSDRELAEKPGMEDRAAELEQQVATLAATGPDSPIELAAATLHKRTAAAGNAKRSLLEIRGQRNRGMAAELAGKLEAGVPCPVCGSTEHPAPAAGAERVPSEEDEKRAEAAVARAGTREDEAREDLAETESRIATERATAEASLAALREKLKKLAEREAGLCGEAPDIETRLEELQEAVGRLDGYLEAAIDAKTTADAAAQAARDVTVASRESGFESVESALAAGIEPKQLKQLETEAAEYDRKDSIVRESLKGELAAVDPSEAVDPGPAREAETTAAGLRDEATGAARGAGDNLKLFRKETGPVAGLHAELGPLREMTARTAELNRLASGKNERRMPLSVFMLATRLRQVIDAANNHLAGMSDQRYTLVYSGDLAGYGAASGLGINVHDSHTSESRSTATLSGGEKFCAALSLALGLAEVVQSESHGKSLESLFIDEGFGTLDAKSLDQVMTVIDSLREGGRSVGLVSHVEEMRDRIAAQIQVTGSREGSTLTVTTG